MEEVSVNLHHLNIWGHQIDIMDVNHSVTPVYIERDLNIDQHGCRELSPAPQFIVDIGANTGIWAIAMAKQYPNSLILAIEPVPLSMDNLKRNCEINKIANVIPIEKAVFGEAKDIKIYQCPGNSGSASIFLNSEWFQSTEVSAITLDTLLVGAPTVDLLKIDIEGAEYQTLKYFTGWDKVIKLTIEVHLLPIDPDKVENAKICLGIMENFYKFLCDKMSVERICFNSPFYDVQWGVKKALPKEYRDPELGGLYYDG